MIENVFTSLDADYYALGEKPPDKKWVDFYIEKAQRAEGPILEPMCGTGRYLIPLMEANLDVYGTDGSFYMLEVLKKTCASKHLMPHIRQELLQDLNQENIYHLVIIPEGSIALIMDIILLKKCLVRIWRSLVKGGFFIFELQLYYPHRGHSVTIYERDDGKNLLCDFSCSTTNYIRNYIRRYELIENNQIIKTVIEWEKLRYYSLGEIYNILEEVGFCNIRFPEIEGQELLQSKKIIFECKK